MKATTGWIAGMALVLAASAVTVRAADDAKGGLVGALASEGRPSEDRARDAGRKPVDVVAFFGIGPGMRVIDLIASGGYYSEVLAAAVGPSGVVYAQNPLFVLKMRDGANDKALTARLARDRLANVKRLDLDLADLELEPASLDAAVTALNFHDVYNGPGLEAATGFLAAVYALLKPGGVLGLIDHSGNADADNAALHRIEEKLVDAAAESVGFEIEAKSDVLRNADDDRSKSVFAPGMRGHTDRFVMRLRKPG